MLWYGRDRTGWESPRSGHGPVLISSGRVLEGAAHEQLIIHSLFGISAHVEIEIGRLGDLLRIGADIVEIGNCLVRRKAERNQGLRGMG